VEIRFAGRPDQQFIGTIRQLLPSGSNTLPSPALGMAAGGSVQTDPRDEAGTQTLEPFFEVRIAPLDTPYPLLFRQRVVVRFDFGSSPLAVQGLRALRQLIQQRFRI
jgi:putative peptide zinc metalloprotease protein